MKSGFQFTLLSLQVGRVFIMEGNKKHWNHEIARKTRNKPDATHRVLKQMLAHRWVDVKKERINPEITGRPARVLYSMTEVGAQAMMGALLAVQLSTFHGHDGIAALAMLAAVDRPTIISAST
jgi:Holliday junction resolvasome RuvABC ATP-dependent DNA helicase subunit